jgi:hypothetical protein
MQAIRTDAASRTNIHRVLAGAAELFRKEKWNQKFMAITASGASVDWDSPEATRYCLVGGICKIALGTYPRFSLEHSELSTTCMEAVKQVLQERGELNHGLTLGEWNAVKGREANHAMEALEAAAKRIQEST